MCVCTVDIYGNHGNIIAMLEETVNLADLTVSKRPGAGYHIEIHFVVVKHLYLLFSFVKLAET